MRSTTTFLTAGVLLLLLNTACTYFDPSRQDDAVARVGDHYLGREEVNKVLNENLSTQDSLVLVNNYINEWAKDRLLFERARINISEEKQEEFEELVSQYRADLYINAYKEALVNSTMDTVVSNEALEAYYEENGENFHLNEDLVKLRYLSVAPEFTGLDEVREKFRRFDQDDIEDLRENALKYKFYSFNDSAWVRVSEVLRKIPVIDADNKDRYLKNSQFLELSDSLGVYLVAVGKVLKRTETAPLEYVAPTIKKIILNKRKLEFIRTLEQDLLNEATSNKEFEIITEQ